MIAVDMHDSTSEVGVLRFHDSAHHHQRREQLQPNTHRLATDSSAMDSDRCGPPSAANETTMPTGFYRVSSDASNRVSVISGSGVSSPWKQRGEAQPDVGGGAAAQPHQGPKILFNLLSQQAADHRQSFAGAEHSPDDGKIAIRYHAAPDDGGEETMNVEFRKENSPRLVDEEGRAMMHPHRGTHSAPSAIGVGSTNASGRCYTGNEQQMRDAPPPLSLLSSGIALTTTTSGGGEFLIPQYCRPRSKSMGTNGWRPVEFVVPAGFGAGWWPSGSTLRAGNAVDVSRTPSRDSLVSYDDSIASSDDCNLVGGGNGSHMLRYHYGGQAGIGRVAYTSASGSLSRDEALIEDARSRLMTLMTNDRQPEVMVGPSGRRLRDGFSHSQPGTPLSSSPLPSSEQNGSSSAGGGVYAGNGMQQQRHFAPVYHHHHHHHQQQQQQQPFVRKYSEGSQMMRTHQGRWRNRAYSMVNSVGFSHSNQMTSSSSGASTAAPPTGEVSACLDSPVDLSCKRKKFEAGSASSAGLPYARRATTGNGNFSIPVPLPRYTGSSPSNGFPQSSSSSLMTSSDRLNASVDEGIDNIADCDDTGSDSSSTSGSLLRSILLQTGRGRSYSMSVAMSAGRPTVTSAARGSETDSSSSVSGRLRWQLTNQTGNSPTSTPLQPNAPPQQQPTRPQRVVLAKKNQLPVMARVADHLGKIVELVRAVPRFELLPLCDRRMLLSNACGRLLLLYMAESNTQFAVTPMITGATSRSATMRLSSLGSCEDASSTPLSDEVDPASGRDHTCRSQSFGARSAPVMSSRCVPGCGQVDAEVPTQQFVDGVQNFIRKCQSLALCPEEYVYMRIIALFHSGAGTLDRVDIAEQVNTEARQRLQDLVQRTHPNEKLRYSSILLTLHTLFGIHCGMLQALFYRPTPEAASFDEFVWNALTATGASSVPCGSDADMVH